MVLVSCPCLGWGCLCKVIDLSDERVMIRLMTILFLVSLHLIYSHWLIYKLSEQCPTEWQGELHCVRHQNRGPLVLLLILQLFVLQYRYFCLCKIHLLTSSTISESIGKFKGKSAPFFPLSTVCLERIIIITFVQYVYSPYNASFKNISGKLALTGLYVAEQPQKSNI